MTEPLKVLITSGGTRERIDPVRYIGNYSSGKMGAALAHAFAELGAEVKVISGPAEVHYKTPMVRVESALQMLEECEKSLPVDIAVFAAAVADKRPKGYSSAKMKKEDFSSIELVDNPDILRKVATAANRPKVVVGFAAESDNHIDNARKKLNKKSCDLVVVNDISALTSDENEVWLITKSFEKKLERASKAEIAKQIAGFILDYFNKTETELLT